jgi:CheY-like chemotaxis protein
VEGAAAGGSAFRFTLTLPVSADAVAGPHARVSTPITAPPDGRFLRVLVAEDNAVNRLVVEQLLKRRGHAPTVVTNGRDAVAAARLGGFDIVLMDLEMPEMDGLEATAAIRDSERRHGARLPIVALTAHALEGDRQRCLDADMDGYLTKPLNPGTLFETIEGIAAAVSSSQVTPA